MSLFANVIGGVLAAIKGFFGNGGVGGAVGNGVANVAAIAALAPAVIWLIANKDVEAVSFSVTWGQLSLICLGMFFILKIIHYSRPGSPSNRSESL